MALCGFPGNSDMYGLGIRLGFYLNWYGSTLASWIARDEVNGMELSNSLFVAATFLALIIQTAQDNLRPVEIYIILLLTFGGYMYFVPLYIWRFMTCWSPRWDPTRYPRVPVGTMFSVLNWFLLTAVALFQLWFWITGVQRSERTAQCNDFGFLFTKVHLAGRGFVAANILLYFFLLLCSVGSLCFWFVKRSRSESQETEEIEQPGIRQASLLFDQNLFLTITTSRVRLAVLQELQTLISLAVTSTILSATELTIIWNGIEDVNEVSSSGQTIPLVIASGLLVRVVYVALFIGDEDPEKYEFHLPKRDPRTPRSPEDGERGPRRPEEPGILPRRQSQPR